MIRLRMKFLYANNLILMAVGVVLELFLRMPAHLLLMAVMWRRGWDLAMAVHLLHLLLLMEVCRPSWVFDLQSLVMLQLVRSRMFPHFGFTVRSAWD